MEGVKIQLILIARVITRIVIMLLPLNILLSSSEACFHRLRYIVETGVETVCHVALNVPSPNLDSLEIVVHRRKQCRPKRVSVQNKPRLVPSGFERSVVETRSTDAHDNNS